MRIKCYGTDSAPHEETQWLGMNWAESFCWYCGNEGLEMGSGKPCSISSVTMRKPV